MITYDKLGCHTWGCSWALLGCFWASPGLPRLSWSSVAAAGCFWAAPGATLLEPRATMKTTPTMTNLMPQIKATANFLGLRVVSASERYVRSLAHTQYHQILTVRSLRRSETNTKSSTYFRRPVFAAFPCFRITLRAYSGNALRVIYWNP